MRIQLRIAGLRVSVRVAPGVTLEPGPEHAVFAASGDEDPDLVVRVSDAEPDFPRGPRLFSAHDDAFVVYASGDGPGTVLENRCGRARRCAVRFSEDFGQADLRLRPWPADRTLGTLPRAWELACFSRLARAGGGFLVHALGLRLPAGVLLPGSSGVGKSTLAASHPPEQTLSDERVALTPGPNGTPWIHGTPWRGSAGRVLAAEAPLEALVFLGPHEPPWGLQPVRRAAAFRRLAFHGFPPFWDRVGLERAIDLAQATALAVPAFELRFQPDADVRAMIRSAL